jgi:meso-butanediol dehydrogenase/(S,S)-butanediol dehydrogenase/diacetyl reductase
MDGLAMKTTHGTPRLDGKVAVVTGAAQGIGAAAARRLAGDGARVLCVDLNEAVRDVAAAIGADAGAIVCDVGNADAAASAIDACVARWGRIDILVNNAGISGAAAPLADGEEANFDRVIDVNLRSCWATMRRALPSMVATGGGSIVNVASVAALIGFETLSVYAASKAAIVGMTRTAALEYGAHNIRVNAVCPGGVLTPLARAFNDDESLKAKAGRHALKRYAEPEEIAAAIAFLASDDASFVTGIAMPVDGGMTAH